MNIFQQLFRMAEFCIAVRFTQLWSGAWPFFSAQTFHTVV